ncbi:MAG: diguanylate cyclase [Candidatus Omnitrophota bacterium]
MERINVLIIEDKAEDMAFLESTLKEAGYKVWTVSGGEEGIEVLKNIPFSVVVTELHMQGSVCIEIIKEALKISPDISVVVITAYTFINLAVEAMELGAYGYITKPFNVPEIKIIVKRAAEKSILLSSKKEKDQYAEMSVKDGLTGAYNRRFLKIYLDNKIFMMNRLIEQFSVLMIDLDHFKKYNDDNGHQAGDEVLCKACKLFAASVLRKGDIVFRYGGEEFLVFLDNADKKSAFVVGERVRNTVNLYLPVTVSIGIGSFPEDGKDLDELIAKSDAALYKAKEGGRNKVCVSE